MIFMELSEKIKALEKELHETPDNKATEKHRGILKAKIARLKEQFESAHKKQFAGYTVKKTGDATVVLIGMPSVGKSTLINALTNVHSKVASYAFTTLEAIPGLMEYNGAEIQIVDVPGLISGASEGKGKGKEVLSVARTADLILILLDVFSIPKLKMIQDELYKAGLRLNKKKPDISIKKTTSGGIMVSYVTEPTKVDEEELKEIFRANHIMNVDVVVRGDLTAEDLIDVITQNKVFLPSLVVVNKADAIDLRYLHELKKQYPDFIFVSAEKQFNLDELREKVYNVLDFIRIYTKPKGKKADMNKPLIVKRDADIEDVCLKLHKDFYKNFKYARIWGGSSLFSGQRAGIKHVLKDGDIVELH